MNWKNLHNQYKSNLERLRAQSSYEILGVSPGVSKEELRNAYISKIKVYHPDKAGKFMESYCQEVTKLINAAYEELMKTTNG